MMTSFEELLNSTEMLKKGDKVKGTVSKVESDMAYVDVDGAQYECVILKNQVSRDFVNDVKDFLKVGDEIEAVVTGIRADRERKSEDVPGVIYLSRKIIENKKFKEELSRIWSEVKEKFDNNELITAKVVSTTKGGLTAEINGLKAFVPASLVDINFVKNYNKLLGKEFTFKIQELSKSENNIVLNRKVVLEEEKAAKIAEAMKNINIGDVIEGKINRITSFGAFVNLGDIDGLVHISEVSHVRHNNIKDVYSVGDVVKVLVLDTDDEKGKISLSIKALLPTQWQIAKDKIKQGDVFEGTVQNITSFGAFVELLPDVEGLVHISQISHDRVNNVKDVLKQGDIVKVKVLEVDFDNERISLSIKDLLEKPVKEEVEKEPDFDTSYLKSEETEFSLADKFKDLI